MAPGKPMLWYRLWLRNTPKDQLNEAEKNAVAQKINDAR